MHLRKYVRQVRPIQENYLKPDKKIQTLLSEADTGFATLMEKAIVMGYNMNQGMSEEEAAEKGNIILSDWEKEKKSLGDSGVKNGMDIAKKLSVGAFMVHTGRANAPNYYNKKLGYAASDTTPKTDIMGDSPTHTFSMKQAGGSFLASPAAAEASGMVKSAILNYENNEGQKVNSKLNEFLKFLEEDFNTLRYNDVLIEAGAGKKEFVEWYMNVSKRRSELQKVERNKKKQDDHMKAELSVFKIPSQMKGYEKKLIRGIKPISRVELDRHYFPTYVADEYQIGTGKEVQSKLSKKKGLSYTVYGQINPDYFTGNDKEVIKDNSALKGQIIKILDTTMNQVEADKKFSSVFESDESFKKYLVYEASSGCYKFTGQVQKGNYSGSEIAVAKKMLSFKGTDVTVYDDIFSWSASNTSILKNVSMDFKGAGKGRYTALKMSHNIDDMNFYEALDFVMEDEWYKLQDLQEGIRDWVASRWRSGKDAIAGMIATVKKLYQKYIQSVVTRLIGMLRDAASKGLQTLFNFLGVELNANVSFGKMT